MPDTDTSLFDLAREPHQLVRQTDPASSTKAAESVILKLSAIRAVVFSHIQRAGPVGMTDWELEEAVGDHGATYRTRRAELVETGMVRERPGFGRANPLSGNTIERSIWVAVPEAERPTVTEHLIAKAGGNRLRDEVRFLLLAADGSYETGIVALSTAIAAGDVEWCRRLITLHFSPAQAKVKEALALLQPQKEKA